MTQFHKTDLGIESLKQRSMNLNARQRRLLLLIGTDDFDLLSEQFKRRIAHRITRTIARDGFN